MYHAVPASSPCPRWRRAGASTRAHAGRKKKVKAKRTDLAKVIADDNRQRMVRRIEMVHGKRKVVYQRVRRAAPALPSSPPATWPA
jgi:D-alanyl-D-alanine endopeptidase (penicillin-binding protein 7)